MRPFFTTMASIWQFYGDTYSGGEDYKKSDYLRKNVIESQDDYNTRLENSSFYNISAQVLNNFSKYLYAKPIDRAGLENIVLTLAIQNVDLFFKKVFTYLLVYGELFVVILPPEDDDSVSLDEVKLGKGFNIKIFSPQDVPVYNDEKLIYYPWICYDMKYQRGVEYPNNGNIVHLVLDQNQNGIPESFIRDIAYLNNEYFNIHNGIVNECINSAFNTLLLPWNQEIQFFYSSIMPKTDDGKMVLETQKIMPYPTGSDPKYLTKDMAGLQFKQGELNLIEEQIYKSASQRLQEIATNQSGVSKAYDFSSLNAQLSFLAEIAEAVETQIFEAIISMNEVNAASSEWEIHYPHDFDVIQGLTDVENITKLLDLKIGKTAKNLALERIVYAVLQPDADTMEIIRNEIAAESEKEESEEVENESRLAITEGNQESRDSDPVENKETDSYLPEREDL